MHPPGDIIGQADVSVEVCAKSSRRIRQETQIIISQANTFTENYDRLSKRVYREKSWTSPT